MTHDKDSAASGAVLGNFQLSANMADGKTFSVSGYLFDSESVESLTERIDLLHDVVDRQRTRAEIPALEAVRENKITHLQQQRAVLAELVSKRDNGGKLSSQEKQMIGNMESSIVALNSDIEKGAAVIAEAKAKVGLK